jgi:hypothetical protein
MTIITDLHALKSIFSHLLYEQERDWPSGEDMSWQIEWLESYIEQLKNSPSLFACPRCDGTGEYDSGFDVTRCRACAGTGRQTKEHWNAWVDRMHSIQPPEIKAALKAYEEGKGPEPMLMTPLAVDALRGSRSPTPVISKDD